MTIDFLGIMQRGLTPAYDRGMERLDITLEPVPGTRTLLARYGFEEYLNRYGRFPDSPRYLLAPRQEPAEPLTVRVFFTRGTPQGAAPEDSVDVPVPVGWPAGRTIAVPLPARAGERTHQWTLTRVEPLAPARPTSDAWRLTALLGNLAKALWVIGHDYEDLTGRLAEIADQRSARTARGASLDLLGLDLGAPRFPPRPHTWDEDTVALYHLDEAAGDDAAVVSVGERFGAPSHRCTNTGARGGRTGRFSRAFSFSGAARVTLDTDSPDFAAGTETSLTVEAVVRPETGTTTTGAVVAKRAVLNTAASPGWALTIGPFRQVDHNLRLTLADGDGRTVELYADRDLGDGSFHHVAAVVERLPSPAGAPPGPPPALTTLLLDGRETVRQRVAQLGSLTSPQPLTLGQGQESAPDGTTALAQFTGLLEEVRISRTARTSFAPVTGEDDAHYRARLHLFQRWLVPTRDGLQHALNETLKEAGPLTDDPRLTADPAPFEVHEAQGSPTGGSLVLRVLPDSLRSGQSIAADGDRGCDEAQAVGTADEEGDFDDSWLCRYTGEDEARLAFTPGEHSRLMQLGVKEALDSLVERTESALSGRPGILHVLRAHEPAATNLYAVGRALLLRHDTLAPGELAVHAHAAGFGWVQHTLDGLVHVAQPAGSAFGIVTGPATPEAALPGTDVPAGGHLFLDLEPSPPPLAGAEVRWTVTRSGAGHAEVTQGAPARLDARAAGEVTVQAEVKQGGHTRGTCRVVRIGLPAAGLAAGQSISRVGFVGADAQATGGPSADSFDPLHLVTRTDDLTVSPRPIEYGTGVADRRMQAGASRALDRLLDQFEGIPDSLQVLRAFDPEGPGPFREGRALELRSSALTGSALAARAFAAGFDHIAVPADDTPPAPGTENRIVATVAPGDQVELSGPTEIRVDEAATLTALGHAEPVDACFDDGGGRLYLSLQGSHRVTSFTVEAEREEDAPVPTLARSEPVMPFPGPLAFVGGRLHVAHERSDTVQALHPVTLAAESVTLTGPRPVALGTDGERLYVAYAGDDSVRAYDPDSGQETGGASLPGTPCALAVAPNSQGLAVLLDGGRIQWLDRPGLAPHDGPVDTGAVDTPAAVFSPDGSRLYVGCVIDAPPTGRTSAVQRYAADARTPEATIGRFPHGTSPLALRTVPNAAFVYVATAGTGSVTGRVHLIDAASGTLLPTVFATGGDCPALALSPDQAPYRPCVLAAPRTEAAVLLADPTPVTEHPARPPRLVSRRSLGPGGEQELAWSVQPEGPGRADLPPTSRPSVRIRALAPGLVPVRVGYFDANRLRPHQCEVRLNPRLEALPDLRMSKDRYDLLLNILNWFHPVGVEMRTARLRRHVPELSGADGDLTPAYTFPTYRTADRHPSRLTHPDKDKDKGDDHSVRP
ncbi:LamG-like jellyroll fold domain-containing protein [Streptomyces sp. NPDC098781]|uniref:LamG-like jellyroll fold domain-containing protein n=1 Tax=Streptomyces sp. NPDC098781 TaxID=3366097 RepID=UPI00380DA839